MGNSQTEYGQFVLIFLNFDKNREFQPAIDNFAKKTEKKPPVAISQAVFW
jgi:hypothetical protein